MKWKEISKTCPKAWEKFVSDYPGYWIDEDGDLVSGGMPDYDIFNERNLYDFFDEEKIYCTVYVNKNDMTFDYYIWIDHRTNWDSVIMADTREDIEADMFTKAFSILDARS